MTDKDLSTIIKLHAAKGAGRHFFVEGTDTTNTDNRFNTTQIGQTRTKIQKWTDAGRKFDLGNLLVNDFPLGFMDALEKAGVTAEEAWAYVTSGVKTAPGRPTKTKIEKEITTLARVLADLEPNTTPEENAKKLSTLITDHQAKALELVQGWEKTNGRNKKGYIRARKEKTKK